MKPKTVNADRFRAIVEAYGASPARWPEDERASALQFMAQSPERARVWLQEARATDRMLDVLKAADAAEFEQVQSQHWQALAQMMRDERGANVIAFPARITAPSRPLPLVWATGIGLAACIAGAVVGMNVSLQSLSNVRAQSVLEQAQMIDAEN